MVKSPHRWQYLRCLHEWQLVEPLNQTFVSDAYFRRVIKQILVDNGLINILELVKQLLELIDFALNLLVFISLIFQCVQAVCDRRKTMHFLLHFSYTIRELVIYMFQFFAFVWHCLEYMLAFGHFDLALLPLRIQLLYFFWQLKIAIQLLWAKKKLAFFSSPKALKFSASRSKFNLRKKA